MFYALNAFHVKNISWKGVAMEYDIYALQSKIHRDRSPQKHISAWRYSSALT